MIAGTSDRVIIRDLVVGAKLGIYTHERHGTQPVRFNIELEVARHLRDVGYQHGVAGEAARQFARPQVDSAERPVHRRERHRQVVDRPPVHREDAAAEDHLRDEDVRQQGVGAVRG